MERSRPVAVLMGGDSSEREISLRSGNAVLKALRSLGYAAEAIDMPSGLDRLVSGNFGCAFIALHGQRGEDGCVQGLLEILRIPYTGSGVLASAATMDKIFSKEIMVTGGVPTPDWEVVDAEAGSDADYSTGLEYPVIVKPACEGSTIGVTKVDAPAGFAAAVREAARYGSRVLVERFISGREVTVGLIGREVFPAVEVVPKKGFYDYESKYTKGMTEYLVPAPLDGKTAEKAAEMARQVYGLFGCRGAARVDIILGPAGPVVLEINTIPGMTETSLLPKAAACAGIGFEKLVEKMLEGAALDAGEAGDGAAMEKREMAGGWG